MRTHYASFHSVKVKTPHRKILEAVSGAIHQGDKIGLVGANGAGKTTMLRVLDGKQSLSAGSIETYGRVFYLPQLDLELFQSQQIVSEYLSGLWEEWWTVLEVLESRYGFEVPVDAPLSQLSGGELVKLHLALAEAVDAEVLLMDEPTNHLDIDSQIIVQDFVREYPKSILVASHDVYFLDACVNRIWELDKGVIREFGGNYSFYREQKRLEDEANARKFEVALKDRARLNRSIAQTNTRHEKNAAKHKEEKSAHDRSVSRMDRGWMKQMAQVSMGKKKVMFDDRLEKNQAKLDEYKPEEHPYIRYEVRADKSYSGMHIIDVRNGSVAIGDRSLIEDIRFNLEYGERVVVLGKNGAGKTTFAKGLLPEQEVLSGEIVRSQTARVEYISQNYDLVDPNKTLVENMKAYNPEAKTLAIRNRLRDFLFFEDAEINKYAGELSGGETARLAFAMVSLFPLEALILDEPTNNLDIHAKEAILNALKDFPGALMIISHDIDFLARMGVDTSYVIADQKLSKVDIEYTHEGVLEEIRGLM